MSRLPFRDRTGFRLRPLRSKDLEAFVQYWNRAFSARRSYTPITPEMFHHQVIECPAYDPAGLIVAWNTDSEGADVIAGFVHAYKPPPDMAAYHRWGRHRTISVLHVSEDQREQGLGSQLLKAAENYLYYCPIHFGAQSVPCYGGVEGPRPPFFGSTQRMGVNVNDTDLLHFLTNRGYKVADPGDISMTADLTLEPISLTAELAQLAPDLRLIHVDHTMSLPFTEPRDRREYESWLSGSDFPYRGLVLVDKKNVLRGHVCWYPLNDPQRAGIYSFWLSPLLRGKGLGKFLLESAMVDMQQQTHLGGPYKYAEVQSHLVRHATAVALYESKGFEIDAAWATLVKT